MIESKVQKLAEKWAKENNAKIIYPSKESRKMNNENTTLKPCPFCGSDAEVVSRHEFANDVRCTSCYYIRHHNEIKEDAVRAWNTRPLEDTLKAKADMFDELVEVCDELMIKVNHLTEDLQTANAPISIFTGNMCYVEIEQKIEKAKELTE